MTYDATEDKLAIHEVLANYCYYFDDGEFDRWIDLFSELALLDLGALGLFQGKEGLRAFLQAVPLTDGLPMMKHCLMNEIINVKGAAGTAKSYLVVYTLCGDSAPAVTLCGRYEDELEKQGGRWLFKKRKLCLDRIG